MATNAPVPAHQNGLAVLDQVITQGNLANLSPADKVTYYRHVCESVGLNPYTKPLDYLVLSGRMVLYANKGAAEQLRSLHGISIRVADQQIMDGLYVVTVEGTDKTGRTDSEIGAVPLGNLAGEARANALMKAVTKAKRRLTLSMCGLGMLDETEVETIPGAVRVSIDHETGETLAPGQPADSPRAGGQAPAPQPRSRTAPPPTPAVAAPGAGAATPNAAAPTPIRAAAPGRVSDQPATDRQLQTVRAALAERGYDLEEFSDFVRDREGNDLDHLTNGQVRRLLRAIAAPASDEQQERVQDLLTDRDYDADQIQAVLSRLGVERVADLTALQATLLDWRLGDD